MSSVELIKEFVADQDNILITCEHAHNSVPYALRVLFSDQEILGTHRAYDLGAFAMAKIIAQRLQARIHYTKATRLIVDCNRSIGSKELFGDCIKQCGGDVQNNVMKRYYMPYRRRIEKTAGGILQNAHMLFHVSLHSFTPQLNGFKRYADIGLLFDQDRIVEAEFSRCIKEALLTMHPLRISFNYPFRGCGDGVTVWLRKLLGDRYCGIEVEVNQELYHNGNHYWRRLSNDIGDAVRYSMQAVC